MNGIALYSFTFWPSDGTSLFCFGSPQIVKLLFFLKSRYGRQGIQNRRMILLWIQLYPIGISDPPLLNVECKMPAIRSLHRPTAAWEAICLGVAEVEVQVKTECLAYIDE